MRLRAEHVLVTCEHASNRVPRRYADLGLSRRQLESHIAWDRGALVLARACSRRLGCPAHYGRWSRLLIDLNRRPGHDTLVAERSFGVEIRGNRHLSRHDCERRLRLYHTPYRQAALADIRRILASHGVCLHLSVHSFTPVVDGMMRRADVGLLYDPSRPGERRFAADLRDALASQSLHVRSNYPYRGTSDGFTSACRKLFDAGRYNGLEIETNQLLLRDPDEARLMARTLSQCVACVLGVKRNGAGRNGSKPA